jgi:hypothetical protein
MCSSTSRRTKMRHKEQSGQDARGPQSGSEVDVSEVPPPVPSPIPSAEYGRGDRTSEFAG